MCIFEGCQSQAPDLARPSPCQWASLRLYHSCVACQPRRPLWCRMACMVEKTCSWRLMASAVVSPGGVSERLLSKVLRALIGRCSRLIKATARCSVVASFGHLPPCSADRCRLQIFRHGSFRRIAFLILVVLEWSILMIFAF